MYWYYILIGYSLYLYLGSNQPLATIDNSVSDNFAVNLKNKDVTRS